MRRKILGDCCAHHQCQVVVKCVQCFEIYHHILPRFLLLQILLNTKIISMHISHLALSTLVDDESLAALTHFSTTTADSTLQLLYCL